MKLLFRSGRSSAATQDRLPVPTNRLAPRSHVLGLLFLSAWFLRSIPDAPGAGAGNAMSFGTPGDFVAVTNASGPLPNSMDQVTVEFWVKPRAASPASPFIFVPDEIIHRCQVHVPWTDGRVYWDFGNLNNGGRLSYSPPVDLVGSWHHFAFVADGAAGTMSIYRNGRLEAQKNGVSPWTTGTKDLWLGQAPFSGNLAYDGDIDEFRFWRVARSAGEIARDFNLRLRGDEPSLYLYFRFDEAGGTSVGNAVAGGLNAAFVGAPLRIASGAGVDQPLVTATSAAHAQFDAVLSGTIKPEGSPTTWWFEFGSNVVNGIPQYGQRTGPRSFSNQVDEVNATATLTNLPPGFHHLRLLAATVQTTNAGPDLVLAMPHPAAKGALDFDGASSLIEEGFDTLPAGAAPFTIEAWINPRRMIEASLVSWGLPQANHRNSLILTPTGLRHSFWENDLDVVVPNLSGAWHHVAATWDGSTQRLFVDGVEAASRVPTTPPNVDNPSLLAVGYGLNAQGVLGYFDGQMDEIRIWNVARTVSELADTRQRPLRGTEPGLVVYLNLDEQDPGFVTDAVSGRSDIYMQGTRVASLAPLDAPIVIPGTPSPVLATTATVRGQVHSLGRPTIVHVEYGTTPGVWQSSVFVNIGSAYAPADVAIALTGLDSGSDYYYRIVAGNSAGTVASDVLRLRTLVIGCGWPIATKTSGGSAFTPQVATDAVGNVVVSGQFTGEAAFGSMAFAARDGGTNSFVGELSPAGDWRWARSISNAWTLVTSVRFGADGVYVAGHYTGAPAFTPDLTLPLNADGGAFAAKLDNTGAWLWVVSVTSPAGPCAAEAAAIAAGGDLVVGGQFAGSARFANATNGGLTLASAGGTNAFVAKVNSAGQWQWVQQAGGPGPEDRVTAIAAAGSVGADSVFVAGQFGGSATFGGTTLTSTGGTDLFLGRLDGNTGQWIFARRGGGAADDRATALLAGSDGDLFLAANLGGAGDFDGIVNLNPGGAGNEFPIVARLSAGGAMQWYLTAPGAEFVGLTLGDGSSLYVIGDFANSLVLGSQTGLTSVGGHDVVIARVNLTDGVWDWARRLGGSGEERAGGMTTDGTGELIAAGSFQLTIPVGYVSLSTGNPQDIFVARLDGEGVYEHNRWTIGQPVPIPAEAVDPSSPGGIGAYRPPSITILQQHHPDTTEQNAFIWSIAERQLYAVRPVTAQISWPRDAADTNFTRVARCVGDTRYPVDAQIQVVGAPAELEPGVDGFRYRVAALAFDDGAGAVLDPASHVLTTRSPGHAVVQYLRTSEAVPDPSIHPSQFIVVRSVRHDDAGLLNIAAATIGTTLRHASHQDPTGRNGFLLFERAPYDGHGDQRAYDRGTRSGQIIPVNRGAGGAADDFVVVWYHTNSITGGAFPDEPVRYLLSWPAPSPTNTLVIASTLGSGSLNLALYPDLHIYQQPDRAVSGFNPNEEHALVIDNRVFALRNDLNAPAGLSEPYVLAKYHDPNLKEWAMRVFFVTNETPAFPFRYPGEAGKEIQPPLPLSALPACGASNTFVSGPGIKDYKGRIHARAAGSGDSPTNLVMQWFYGLQPGFWYDLDGDGQTDVPDGSCLPWLDRLPGGTNGRPVDVTYRITWPVEVPLLEAGDALLGPKLGLPGIRDFASAKIVFDQSTPNTFDPPTNSLVRIIDPISDRVLELIHSDIVTSRPGRGQILFYGVNEFTIAEADSLFLALARQNVNGLFAFPDLPYSLRLRLFYDPLQHALVFRGVVDESQAFGGPTDPLVLPNILTDADVARVLKAATDNAMPADRRQRLAEALNALRILTRNPNQLSLDGNLTPDDAFYAGLSAITNVSVINTYQLVHENFDARPKALMASLEGGGGYVTIAENDDERLPGLPVSLHVLRVGAASLTGDIKVIPPDNVFDERLPLRHSAVIPSELPEVTFEWYYHPADASFNPTNIPVFSATSTNLNGWLLYKQQKGLNEIVLGDGGEASLLTLGDNYFVSRYLAPHAAGWSGVAGRPGGGGAQLAEGFVKRVVNGLNPFEARTRNFHDAPAATYASMIRQAGRRYEGDIAYNPDPNYLNRVGLIEAYETVLRRARDLSIEGVPAVNFGPANNALLLAASRISQLYMLLGHEAFADAADPTIGFRTDGTGYGSLAPSIFTFQNQLDSLLEEELSLLRGRDDRHASARTAPVYNRLFWNFTHNEGEVAYAQTYNVTDENQDGVIDADDAATLYPQGHGDAWGHYLTALTTYYQLLRNTNFTWIPRTEAILLAGQPVEVDYLDERKFAQAAAARARTGAEILDLTYRSSYVDDPAGQFQGYQDADPARAWGVDDWARRAGTGAYLDWVMANALLPAVDPNPNHAGLQKIDRTTTGDLGEIISAYNEIEAQMDKADAGLNPLGVAKNAVPFDIDPVAVADGKTHFEQIYERALKAVNNAVTVFDHANQLSTALRSSQDSVSDFTRNVEDQELDYKNRLIETFGYPYAGDIGPGKTYPNGYDGPDLYHYMYVASAELTGETLPPSDKIVGYFKALDAVTLANLNDQATLHFFSRDLPGAATLNTNLATDGLLAVEFPVSPDSYGFKAPAAWGQRRAPGEIQVALSELLQGQARLRRGLLNYDAVVNRFRDAVDAAEAHVEVRRLSLRIQQDNVPRIIALTTIGIGATIAKGKLGSLIETVSETTDTAVESIPKVVGLANDVTAPLRGAIRGAAQAAKEGLRLGKTVAEVAGLVTDAAIQKLKDAAQESIDTLGYEEETAALLRTAEQVAREEAPARAEVFALGEQVNQAIERYRSALARGERLVTERIAYRQRVAARTQQARYQDMTFRIFRNDALQKYRAQFDLAARYVFLAAVAYDFETQLLGGDSGSGREFLTDIIRQRSLGQLEDGRPIAGRHGLADPLARLGQNFEVLKGQLGFNNPQTETGRFSLRRELFRIRDGEDGSWRAELQRHRVANLWELPEFRRYCRPFAPESAGPQPGIVIRFPTTVTFGLNYFAWPLGGGDNAYDPTLFATKIRSAGVWFEHYLGTGLSQTPRVYLVPAGADVMRSPGGDGLEVRIWRVLDQKLPVPFPIGFLSLSDPAWIPMNDSLSDTFADLRRFSSFRAYHDSGAFSEAETVGDSRLIGRSVWNSDWMLIIPGGTFLNDPDQGLDAFIGAVTDVKIFFQTYAYSGN